MPLPDERPRPSVANLIGKFETQNKRLSLSASSPSRSSSVVSHITGDSAKEEVKERREWPPKSVTDSGLRQSQVVSSFAPRHIPAPLITPSTSSDKKDTVPEPEVPLTAKALNASQIRAKPDPSSFLENWRKDLPPPQAAMDPEAAATATSEAHQSTLVTPTPGTVKKFGTPPTPRNSNAASKTVPSKTPSTPSKAVASSASSKTTVKTSLKSPPSKQSLQSSVTTPLRPQHTGQSVASSATTRKVVPKTPIPPKTRPEASRAKTPTATRPKTPSTGLFAPTAASLARSRNAPPPVPTPVKKATLSSSSMDRLSKPTAASQARMAAAATSTTRSTPATATRPSAIKPKVATTPRKEKKEQVQPAATGAAGVASVASIGLVAASLENGDKANENPSEDIASPPASASPLAHDDSEEIRSDAREQSVEGDALVELHADSESIGSAAHEATPTSPSPVFETGHIEVEAEETSEAEETTEVEETPVADPTIELHEQLEPIATNGKDDLEDIVNLLETVSIGKPQQDVIDNIPDEIMEIPDEDDK